MGRTPRKRDTPGVIFIRLPADEYNAALEELVIKRHTTFQDHVRNLLLTNTNNKKMIMLLESLSKEKTLSDKLMDRVTNLLAELKGLRV